jgi:hypothetical protein
MTRKPKTLHQVNEEITAAYPGRRIRAYGREAGRWMDLSSAYARAGQFREADDAETEAIMLQQAADELNDAIFNQ